MPYMKSNAVIPSVRVVAFHTSLSVPIADTLTFLSCPHLW